MSHELQIPRQDRAGDTATLEWGDERPAPSGRLARVRQRFGGDRRGAQLAGALGAVAAFVSLTEEWTVTSVPDAGRNGSPVEVPAGVAEVGAFGTGYLVGLFGVLAALALLLFGTAAAARNARVLGLAATGALAALLLAAALTLEQMAGRLFFFSDDERFRIELGPGLTFAFAATVLLGTAIVLAGRAALGGHGTTAPGATAAGMADQPGDPPDGTDGWAGPDRHRAESDAEPHGPIDLTVSAAPPIVPPRQE
ncbi:hypothetical protein [Plantactinospora sp. GCM10030261]|uniref:hypothetical protein n=1 Tax=Plantactinospora sp. GCM10030261 TaxID=3273420 RepID=UPI00360AB791